MTSSKKKLLLISALSIVTVLIVGVFTVLQVNNVKTSNNLQELNTSSAKAFNDVKMLEEVLNEENIQNLEGTSLIDTDKEFLKGLGFTTEEELSKFRLYTTQDIIDSKLLSESYKTQFTNIYAGEEYYIDVENKIIILKNSRMVENTDAVSVYVDDKFKVKEADADKVKETKVELNGEEKTYVNVYVRPQNDDVSVTNKDSQTKLQTIGEVDHSDYAGYPVFKLNKETNIKYIVELVKHNDMKKLQYSLDNKTTWLDYTEPFVLNQNTTIYTRYAVVENPTDTDYELGNMKTISELKLLQTEVEVVKNLNEKSEYAGYKAVIRFKINEDENKYISENFPGAKITPECKVAFLSNEKFKERKEKLGVSDDKDVYPLTEEYDDVDKSDIADLVENKEVRFKAEEEGVYYLYLKATITTDSPDPIYIAESKERVVTIKAENKEEQPDDIQPDDTQDKDDVDLDDPLYSTELSNMEIKVFDVEGKEYEGSKATITLEGEETPISTLEELVSIINSSNEGVNLNVKVDSNCDTIEVKATATEPEKTTIAGLAPVKLIDGKVTIEIVVKSGDGKTKTIKINVSKELPTEIDDTQVINLSTEPQASHSIGGYYLPKEKEDFDITDKNYMDSSAPLLNYIKDKENPTIYVRVETGCEKLIINIKGTEYELNLNEATVIDETKIAEIETLTGKYYELKSMEKEVKVSNNGKEYTIKFVVYKYDLKETNPEDGSNNEDEVVVPEILKDLYFEKEDQTVQLVKNTTSQNLKLILKEDKVDVTKLQIKLTQKYIADEFQEKVISLGELTKSESQPNEKATYYDLPVLTENYGKAQIEVTYEGEETLTTKLTVMVVPEMVVTSPIELTEGETSNISYEVTDLEGKEVKYESKDTSIAKVDENGIVTGVAAGEANVEVTVTGKMKFYKIVEDKPVEAEKVENEEVANTDENVENEVTNSEVDTENSNNEEEKEEIEETITLVGIVSVKVNAKSTTGGSSGGGGTGGHTHDKETYCATCLQKSRCSVCGKCSNEKCKDNGKEVKEHKHSYKTTNYECTKKCSCGAITYKHNSRYSCTVNGKTIYNCKCSYCGYCAQHKTTSCSSDSHTHNYRYSCTDNGITIPNCKCSCGYCHKHGKNPCLGVQKASHKHSYNTVCGSCIRTTRCSSCGYCSSCGKLTGVHTTHKYTETVPGAPSNVKKCKCGKTGTVNTTPKQTNITFHTHRKGRFCSSCNTDNLCEKCNKCLYISCPKNI